MDVTAKWGPAASGTTPGDHRPKGWVRGPDYTRAAVGMCFVTLRGSGGPLAARHAPRGQLRVLAPPGAAFLPLPVVPVVPHPAVDIPPGAETQERDCAECGKRTVWYHAYMWSMSPSDIAGRGRAGSGYLRGWSSPSEVVSSSTPAWRHRSRGCRRISHWRQPAWCVASRRTAGLGSVAVGVASADILESRGRVLGGRGPADPLALVVRPVVAAYR